MSIHDFERSKRDLRRGADAEVVRIVESDSILTALQSLEFSFLAAPFGGAFLEQSDTTTTQIAPPGQAAQAKA
jgi:hypothetical protein